MNIRIRPYRVDDARVVVEAALESTAQAYPWMPWCHPAYALDESRSWLEAQTAAFEARTAFEFAIVSADGRYLGGCGLNQIDAVNRRANLGYWVRSTATRQGVATAAVRALRLHQRRCYKQECTQCETTAGRSHDGEMDARMYSRAAVGDGVRTG